MIKKWLKEYIDRNKKDILYITSFLIIGIVIGICLYIFASSEVKNLLINKSKEVFDISKNDSFIKANIILNAIKFNIILIAILAILSTMLFGKWITYGIIILKGISLSIYTILLFNIFGILWGFVVVFLLVIMVNVIYIPALIYIVICFLDVNFNIFKLKPDKKYFYTIYNVVFSVLITLLIMLSSSVVEQISSSLVLNIYSKI